MQLHTGGAQHSVGPDLAQPPGCSWHSEPRGLRAEGRPLLVCPLTQKSACCFLSFSENPAYDILALGPCGLGEAPGTVQVLSAAPITHSE